MDKQDQGRNILRVLYFKMIWRRIRESE